MENQIWYDVSGTPTKLTDIKYGSFHYHADIGSAGKVRLGGVCSSFVEFDYNLANGVTLSVGDTLKYYQHFPEIDNAFNASVSDIDYFVGWFYVTSLDDNGKLCHVVAYDAVSKLNVDFSAYLKSIEASFPLALMTLLSHVETVAGVTFDSSVVTSLFPNLLVRSSQYFYANGITCWDVVKSIAEICCYYVRATDTEGEIKLTFGGGSSNSPWQNSGKYIICPDDGTYLTTGGNTAINVWYKENGLNLGDEISAYDGLDFYDKNGDKLNSGTYTNPYKFFWANSIFVLNSNNFSLAIYNDVRNIINLTGVNTGNWFAGTIRLFPFRFPFKVGQVVRVVDSGGTIRNFPIMFLDLSESEVVIESYSDKTVGAEAQIGVGSGGEDRSFALDVRVTDLESKVDGIYPNFKIYDSVTQLGLTSGSATIAGAYSALGKDEMLMCPATEFSASEVPSTSGCMVEMAKRYADGSSGRIIFWGRTALIGDYRMFVGDSPFAPTGVWVSLEGQAGALPNNTDLNTVTTPGTYLIDGNNTYTNSPTTYGTFECISHRNDRVYMQRITNLSRIYWRYATNTSTTPPQWGSWYYVAGTQV